MHHYRLPSLTCRRILSWCGVRTKESVSRTSTSAGRRNMWNLQQQSSYVWLRTKKCNPMGTAITIRPSSSTGYRTQTQTWSTLFAVTKRTVATLLTRQTSSSTRQRKLSKYLPLSDQRRVWISRVCRTRRIMRHQVAKATIPIICIVHQTTASLKISMSTVRSIARRPVRTVRVSKAAKVWGPARMLLRNEKPTWRCKRWMRRRLP